MVACSDPKRERLTRQHRVGLPVLAPIPAQGYPAGLGSFDRGLDDISCTSDVGDQDQVEVTETVNLEPDPSLLAARNPAVRDGNDSGAVLGNPEEHWHCKIEVRARRVAPPAIVIWQSIIRGAEIGGSDENGRAARVTPLRFISTFELKTSSATEPIVEQSCAQRCSIDSVSLAV